MSKFNLYRNVNSDKRKRKKHVFYDDSQTTVERNLIEATALIHLKRERTPWVYPTGVRFKYSKVSEQHKKAAIRRRANVKRRHSKRNHSKVRR